MTDGSMEIPTNAYIKEALGMDSETERRLYHEHQGRGGDIENHFALADKQNNILRESEEANFENYASAVQEIIESRNPLPGSENFIDSLITEGFNTVLLSSAPTSVNLPVAEQLGAEYVFKWKDYVFDDLDFSAVYVNPAARFGKHQVIEEFQERGKTVFHFGNGDNDKEAYRRADGGLRTDFTEDPEKMYSRAIEQVREFEY